MSGTVVEYVQCKRIREEKPQISPLRYAPVEMTILFGNKALRCQAELSSRPERSVVERFAVSLFGFATALDRSAALDG